MIVAMFLVYPSIAKAVFQLLTCQTFFEGDANIQTNRLVIDTDIDCNQSEYFFPWFLIGIFGLILWVIGIPALALGLLIKDRKILWTHRARHLLGFLYNGYELKYYWWEVWGMYRKAFIVMVAVLLRKRA